MKIHVGTSGYGYKAWKGKFYPEKTAPGEMLRFYAKHLKTVEINNTFYQMPRENILATWAEQVPDDFVFALKTPQVITHLKQLKNVDAEMERFLGSLRVLGNKLGPILFQFPASFHVEPSVLKDFLGLIPGVVSCAFGFRSRSRTDAAILDLLREKGCSLCIEDTDMDPAQEIVTTAGWGYLRLRRSDYTDADLSDWMKRIVSQRWERVFVFFKHEEEAKGPNMAVAFQKLAGVKA